MLGSGLVLLALEVMACAVRYVAISRCDICAHSHQCDHIQVPLLAIVQRWLDRICYLCYATSASMDLSDDDGIVSWL